MSRVVLYRGVSPYCDHGIKLIDDCRYCASPRHIHTNGYVLVDLRTDDPGTDKRGRIYEHRLIMQRRLGRPLSKPEVVHHIDGDKRNNHPDNLEVMPTGWHHRAAHAKRADLQKPSEDNPLVSCACGCGSQIEKYDKEGRPRRFIRSHNVFLERTVPDTYRPWILSLLSRGVRRRDVASLVGCGMSTLDVWVKRWRKAECS